MIHRAAPACGGPLAMLRRSSGVVLLEVVLALGVFFAAAAVILGGLNASIRAADRLQYEAQAADLAVSLLSDVQMGLMSLIDDGPNNYEEDILADWTWEIVVDPAEENPSAPPLLRVEVIIRNEVAGCTCRLVQLIPEEDDSGEEMMTSPTDALGGGL